MQPHIIAIVLAAAFCHAAWNASVKRGGDKVLALAGMQVASVVLVLPLIPLVGLPHAASWPYLLASVALHFGYYVFLARAYRYGDFAQAYPVARGFAPVLVTMFGVLLLGEALLASQWAALALILGGIMIFATRRLADVLAQRQALSSALITSCFIGGYTLVDGIGGRLSANIPAYMVWLSVLDGVPMALYAWHTRPRAQVLALAAGWRTSLAAAVLALAAYSLVVWAMSQTTIALVAALRETSVIIAALIGAYYFKEPSGWRRIAASVVIFFGIVLLGWGAR